MPPDSDKALSLLTEIRDKQDAVLVEITAQRKQAAVTGAVAGGITGGLVAIALASIRVKLGL